MTPGRISPARPRLRGFSAALAALGLAASAWVLQSPEDAHAGLQSAQPSRSAHLERAPDQVRLDFGQTPVPGSRTKVVVLSPGDANLARGPASASSAAVSQRVAPLRERGAYQVSYEVQLVDGSVSTGQYWFWYAPGTSGSGSWLGSTGLAFLSLLAAAVLALALARRRTRKAVAIVSSARVPAQRSRDRHAGVSPPGSRRSSSSRRGVHPELKSPTRPRKH